MVLAAALGVDACGGSSTSASSHSPAVTPGQASSTTATGPQPATTSTPTSTQTAAATTQAAVPACATAVLRLSLASGAGAAGTAYFYYDLTNAGPTACSLIGYPGVAVLDAHGRVVQHPARRRATPQARVRLVILGPGKHARFLVNSTDVIPSPGCPRTYSGTTLQVYPPNQRKAIRLPRHGPFCNLRVGPVQPAG
jgi:Protein of unknown function (DUF4232)